MKIAPLFVILFIFTVTVCAQHFEGKIIYQNKYKSKIAAVSDEQLTGMMGSRQEYFIKGGNYKSVTDGTYLQWQIYVNRDNRLYNKFSNSDSILSNDGATAGEPVMEVLQRKDVTEILGYKCDELILKRKNQTSTYYFNQSMSVDATLYSKHLFGGWHEYLKLARALPLKGIIDTPQFTLTTTAIEVIPLKIEDKEFILPQNAKIQRIQTN